MKSNNNNSFDLSNTGVLDESFGNFTNESLLDGLTENTSLLNADGDAPKSSGGGAGQYVNADTIQAGLAVTTAVASGIQASRNSPAGQSKKELKAVCGRKPLLKKNKAKYQECVTKYIASKQAPVYTPPPVDRSVTPPPVADDKILGMPKPLAIGLGIVLLAGLSFVGYKMYKARAVKA